MVLPKADEVLCNAKYLGYVPLWCKDVQMLEPSKRSALCEECIRRVCEANRLIKPSCVIDPKNKTALNYIQDKPNLAYSNEIVNLKLNEGGLMMSSCEQSKPCTLTSHLMAYIWAVHAMKLESADYLAYIGKNEKQQVACFVLAVTETKESEQFVEAYKRISSAICHLYSGVSITRL